MKKKNETNLFDFVFEQLMAVEIVFVKYTNNDSISKKKTSSNRRKTGVIYS